METKACKCCRKDVPLTGYYAKHDNRDGLEKMCKTCREAQSLGRYYANKGAPKVKPVECPDWPLPAEADLITQLLNLHNRRRYGAIPGGLLRAGL